MGKAHRLQRGGTSFTPAFPRRAFGRLGAVLAAVLVATGLQGTVAQPAAADFISGIYGVGTRPHGVAAGDFDGDGLVDLATANVGSNDVSVLSGVEDGTFTPDVALAVGSSPFAIVAGHFNGDAASDLAVANLGSDDLSILLGRPVGGPAGGGLQPGPTIRLGAGAGPAGVAAADFDGDGTTDLAVANFGTNNVSILRGRGDGAFDVVAGHAVGAGPISITAADIDGDAASDLVVANSGSNNLSVLRNAGGSFPGVTTLALPAPRPLQTPPTIDPRGTLRTSVPTAVAAGDLTADGAVDLVVAVLATEVESPRVETTTHNTPESRVRGDRFYVLAGAGGGTFDFGAPQEQRTGSNPRGLALADLNGDGRADVAVAHSGKTNANSDVSVLLSSLDRPADLQPSQVKFDKATPYGAGLGPRSVLLNDVNRDGRPDLVAGNHGSDSLTVLHARQASGAFGTALTYPTAIQPDAIAAADFNHDLVPDLVTGHANGSEISILLANGDGTFRPGPVPRYSTGEQSGVPAAVAVGHLNDDGHVDIVVANLGSGKVARFLGQGNGEFSPLLTGLQPGISSAVAIGDVMGDPNPDLVLAFPGSDRVGVAKGKGDGSFDPIFSSNFFAVGDNPVAIATADLDGDGRLDIAVANQGTKSDPDEDAVLGSVSVLLGRADRASFAVATSFAAGAVPRSIAAADLNDDQRPDLVVGNASKDYGTSGASVLLARAEGGFAPPVLYPAGSHASWVGTGDFNGDGRPDLAVTTENKTEVQSSVVLVPTIFSRGTVSIFLATGGGAFDEPLGYAAGEQPSGAAVADFNGDGRLDLGISNRGAETVAVLIAVPDTPPTAPTEVSATAGDGSATVQWKPPAHHGGANITGYVATAFAGGEVVATRTTDARTTSATFTGLTNGEVYLFRLAATNAIGTGRRSAPSNAVIPGDPAVVLPAPDPAAVGPASVDPAAVSPAAADPVAADGGVVAFGDARFQGSTGGLRLNQPVVGMAPTPSGAGYWLVASDGGVFAFGDATFHGSTGNLRLNQPVVGIAPTPTGAGYWLVASDGGVFAFGDARFRGSTGGLRLNKPVVGMAPTPSGAGYWLMAADGGVFAFGDARFRGSIGAIRLNHPVVGMARTPTGAGYWLVASDGGVFAFGDARFRGSTGALRLNKPVVGMAPTPSGAGYRLVAADGGVFAFGDARFGGSTGALRLNQPVVGMAPAPSGAGYWLVAADGGVFAFGDAGFGGSAGPLRLNMPVPGTGLPQVER